MQEEMETGGTEATNETTGSSELSGISADLLTSLGIQPESTHGTGEGKAHDGTPEDGTDESEGEETLEAGSEEEGAESEETDETSEEAGQEEPQELVEVIHNGKPVKMSMEDLKSYAQKGFDYTTKTMTLSEERKAIEEEKKKFEEELQNQLKTYEQRRQELDEVVSLKDQWDFYINSLEQSDPDLFEEIKNGFQKTAQHFQNPVLTAQMQKMRELEERYQKDLVERENQQIRTQFQSGLDTAKKGEWGQLLDQLGMKLDEAKVRDAWVNSEGSVDDAIKQVYAQDVIKRLQSKSKVSTTKKKASSKKVPTAGTAKSTKPVKETGIKANARTPWSSVLSQVTKEYLK